MTAPKIGLAIVLTWTFAEAARTLRGATRGTTPCELRRWHIDIDSGSRQGCSNSWKVPSSWRLIANEARLFYESSEHCCADLFGEEGKACHLADFCECEADEEDVCVVKTIREQTYPLDEHCAGAPKWHLDLDTGRGCTNSPRFPDAWRDPVTALDMFFDTTEGCCEKFTSRGVPCTSHDICGYYRTKVRNEESGHNTAKQNEDDLA